MSKRTIWKDCAVLMGLLTIAYLFFAVSWYSEFVLAPQKHTPGMGLDGSWYINSEEEWIKNCSHPCIFGIKVGRTTRPEAMSMVQQNFCPPSGMGGRCIFENDRGCLTWGAHSERICIAIEYKSDVVSKLAIETDAIIKRLNYGEPIGISNISATTSAIYFVGGVSAEFGRSETISPTLKATKLIYLDPQTLVTDLRPWPGWYATQTDKLLEIVAAGIIVCWLELYFTHRRLFVRKRKTKKRFATPEPSKGFDENPPFIL